MMIGNSISTEKYDITWRTQNQLVRRALIGPVRAGEEALARRYRAVMESWQVVNLTADVAESAARFRASLGLKLADAIQAASALAINAEALVTHDRDFSSVKTLTVLR